MASILELASSHVRHLHTARNDNRLTFHNYHLTSRLVQKMAQMAESEHTLADERAIEITKLAGWFCFTGFLFDAKNAAGESLQQAKEFLEKHKYGGEKTGLVLLCLRAGWQSKEPETLEEQAFSDAVNAVLFAEDYANNSPLKRLELEFLQNQHVTDQEWTQFQLQQLMTVRFYTAYGKEQFEPLIAQNILEQKRALEKIIRKQQSRPAQTEILFRDLGPRVSQRAIQTFFRTNYRNHINLSSIADNKANIMISVNAILISVIISILSYRNLVEANPVVLMPAVIFLVTGLTSLIFAILSARPKVTNLLSNNPAPEQAKRNLIFFGNFVNLPVEEYEAAMDEMFRDGSLLIGNMTRDLYYLGKVLDKKYKYLTISYNVFMIGFIGTVVLFLAAFVR